LRYSYRAEVLVLGLSGEGRASQQAQKIRLHQHLPAVMTWAAWDRAITEAKTSGL